MIFFFELTNNARNVKIFTVFVLQVYNYVYVLTWESRNIDESATDHNDSKDVPQLGRLKLHLASELPISQEAIDHE